MSGLVRQSGKMSGLAGQRSRLVGQDVGPRRVMAIHRPGCRGLAGCAVGHRGGGYGPGRDSPVLDWLGERL